MSLDLSVKGHIKQGRAVRTMVWYGGTDALKAGEAVCYNKDYGTAIDADGSRANRVERPSASNSDVFAGVAARSYVARTGGQMIEIYEPGSKSVPVALAANTVLGAGLLTFVTAATAVSALGTATGRFVAGKFRGRGSAIPRQTKTALLEENLVGGLSLATDGITLTVADSSEMTAGDTVLILGGEDEDGVAYVVPGKYSLASITNATTVVLASSAVASTPAGAVTLTAVIYTGNPTALCDLLDGEESGGAEFISPPNAGAAAQAHTTNGLSYVCGGVTLAADVDAALAQGVLPGEKKAFVCLGTLTTNDFTVPPATAGLQQDGASALASLNAFDAADDAAYLEFNGAVWRTTGIAGGVAESAV